MARGNLLSQLGRGLSGFGAGIQDPSFAIKQQLLQEEQDRILKQQQVQQQQRQQLGSILSGQSIPAFARPGGAEPQTPQETRRQQLAQLSSLATPEAIKTLSGLSPLTQKPAAPLSSEGKIQADVTAGRLTPELGKRLLEKAAAPRAPLVQVGGKAETEGQKVLSKRSAENVVAAQDAGGAASDVKFSADRLQVAIGRGSVGKFAEPKAFLTEVATALGLEVDPKELERAVDVRAVNRILGDKALVKLSALKGSTSERDLRFGQSIAGRVSEGKGSVQEVADLMNASAIKAQQIAEIANNGILEGKTPRVINIEVNRAKNSIKLKDIFEEVTQDRLAKQAEDLRQKEIQELEALKSDPRVQQALSRGIPIEEIKQFMQTRGVK